MYIRYMQVQLLLCLLHVLSMGIVLFKEFLCGLKNQTSRLLAKHRPSPLSETWTPSVIVLVGLHLMGSVKELKPAGLDGKKRIEQVHNTKGGESRKKQVVVQTHIDLEA